MRCNAIVANNCAVRMRRMSGLRSCDALSALGDEVLPRVAVAILRAFVKALIERRELSQRPREFDLYVCQLERLRKARLFVTALKYL